MILKIIVLHAEHLNSQRLSQRQKPTMGVRMITSTTLRTRTPFGGEREASVTQSAASSDLIERGEGRVSRVVMPSINLARGTDEEEGEGSGSWLIWNHRAHNQTADRFSLFILSWHSCFCLIMVYRRLVLGNLRLMDVACTG